MASVNESPQPRRRSSLRLALLSPFAYLGMAVLCLRHWQSATPWRDLDFFSGGFFVLTAIRLVYEIRFNRGIFDSPEKLREISGLSYDPATVRWGNVLAIFDLSVFLDYGHWHLIAALRVSGLQIAGLAIYACGMVGLTWTDTCLVRHFQGDLNDRQLVTTGPFAFVRHPRYASLLLTKLGFSFLLASIFAWTSLLAWILMVRRRIRLEEAHLRQIFGASYNSYAQRTRRLLPRFY
jgi:protein-S-isoprenylcysteine O-methyltransferase Ste14